MRDRHHFIHRPRRKKLICLMALFGGLLLAEIGVRLGGWQAIPCQQAVGSLFQPVEDKQLLFVNAISGTKTIHFQNREGELESLSMNTNAQRFRGPLVERAKPKGTYRIACLGDSHTWGDAVPGQETWPAHLQALVPKHVEVLNCGVNGYDTLQELLWYEQYVEPFDPDVVLLAYFPNDVAARGMQDATAKSDWLYTWTHPHRDDWLRTLRKRSRAVDVICDRVYRWRTKTQLSTDWASRYSSQGKGWKQSQSALLRLRERCEQDQRGFAVLLFPCLVPDGDVFLSHTALKVVEQFCRDHAIPHFDGEPALLKARRGKGPYFLCVSEEDIHGNGVAYQAFAKALNAWLKLTGILPWAAANGAQAELGSDANPRLTTAKSPTKQP